MLENISEAQLEILRQQIKDEILAEQEKERIRQEKIKEDARIQAEKDYKEAMAERKRVMEEFKDKEEPWVNIIGMVEDPDKGVRIELDWNTAMIRYLKANGFDGPNEDAVIQQWLQAVMANVVSDIEMAELEREATNSEFE